MELTLNSERLAKILLTALQFPHTPIEHRHKASNQPLIATQQYASRRQQQRIEAKQRAPGSPLHHTFMQPFIKKQFAGALPTPAQTEVANGRNNGRKIVQPFALLARQTLGADNILVVDSNLH